MSEEWEYVDLSGIDSDDFNAEEVEDLEEELVDSATAAQTIEELDAEIRELDKLIATAKTVRDAGRDRKWTELATILQDNALAKDASGKPRKIIIFTEHRDTLDYLYRKITTLIGKPDAVKAIHGGVHRAERRIITEEFTKNPDVQILIATDAAGEGLNLQAAHLMVNYDLPWNPNRIEQRFGRIHRIGQEEVCRLWNIVAANTREGEVFTRLLEKLEQMRKTYGGKVFDVLGESFTETPLRDLLLRAIRYGELPETRQKMQEVINASVGDGIKDLLAERALATEHLAEADLQKLREAMDEARARRLQPYYIEMAFIAAFKALGGRIVKREKGRYEIPNVPGHLRNSNKGPIATKYERVTFDLDYIHTGDDKAGVRADLIAPGHPLHDAVMFETNRRFGEALNRGTTLVSEKFDQPQLLVGVIEEVTDATGVTVNRRFGYAYVDEYGQVTSAGPAPYLNCVAAPSDLFSIAASSLPWLGTAEDEALSYIISHQLPEFLADTQAFRLPGLEKERVLVNERLISERDRLINEATIAAEAQMNGKQPKETPDSLKRKAAEIDARLHRRLEKLSKQEMMATKPPRIVTSALVLPFKMAEGKVPPTHAKETDEVDRRAVDMVLASERALGRRPVEMPHNNKGFDILSHLDNGDTIRVEVKGRIKGADDFWVSNSEVMLGKNAVPKYRLAIVEVNPDGAQHDQVRYLDDIFQNIELGGIDSTGIKIDWKKTWAKGQAPF